MTCSDIRIWYENFHVRRSDTDEDLPLAELNPDECCIHGDLRIEIGGREVPYLGFFGRHDVCFGTWLKELHGVAAAFSASENTSYLFDEGEQGQPAYLFERQGNHGFLSIVDSKWEGKGDPEWQRVEFLADRLVAEYQRVSEQFYAAIRAGAPASADEWMQANDLVTAGGA